jgi:hypothetical protein
VSEGEAGGIRRSSPAARRARALAGAGRDAGREPLPIPPEPTGRRGAATDEVPAREPELARAADDKVMKWVKERYHNLVPFMFFSLKISCKSIVKKYKRSSLG